jgi:hypothetical protein
MEGTILTREPVVGTPETRQIGSRICRAASNRRPFKFLRLKNGNGFWWLYGRVGSRACCQMGIRRWRGIGEAKASIRKRSLTQFGCQ